MLCSYCDGVAGYIACCRDAMVCVCVRHVGSACAGWLYDMGMTAVEVRRLERKSAGQEQHEAD